MKKMFFSVVILLLTTNLFSQKIINEPKTGFTTAPYLQIKKIEITDSTTVLSIKILGSTGAKFNIPKKTHIKDVTTNEKLFIKRVEGVPMAKQFIMPESGFLDCNVIFGKLNTSVTKIDYGEDGGDWFIYDIDLQNESNQS
ncbi:MAG: hypothetical protein QG594_1514, partial [Bacteroidota bacterium]|nr:hypothetical protein [Bacteroidota bacterium]